MWSVECGVWSVECEVWSGSATQKTFRHGIKQVGMSQSATPATQNDITTCLTTFEKEWFFSFPHRQGDATGKPETRDETRGRRKTRMSCETSSNFDTFDTLSNRLEVGMSQSAKPATQKKVTTCLETFEIRGFAASPIDTATPKENQRIETRHVGSSKQAFRARGPPILKLWKRYQTVWNVTKRQACHAKQHDNLLGNLRPP